MRRHETYALVKCPVQMRDVVLDRVFEGGDPQDQLPILRKYRVPLHCAEPLIKERSLAHHLVVHRALHHMKWGGRKRHKGPIHRDDVITWNRGEGKGIRIQFTEVTPAHGMGKGKEKKGIRIQFTEVTATGGGRSHGGAS